MRVEFERHESGAFRGRLPKEYAGFVAANPLALVHVSNWLREEAATGHFTRACIEFYEGSEPMRWRWVWMSGGTEP